MSNQTAVNDLDGYSDGFQKGVQLVETHKKLVSVSASFIKSLTRRGYHGSFHQGVADGWDFGFKKQKEKLQNQAKEKFNKRQNEIKKMKPEQEKTKDDRSR